MPKKSRSSRIVKNNYRNTLKKLLASGASIQRGLAFAPSQIVTMRYAETRSLDAGAGTSATLNYHANSVYDPYAGVGGHQPMGFDEWAKAYFHCTVLKSKISVTFCTIGAGVPASSAIGSIVVAPTNVQITGGVSQIIEQASSRPTVYGYMGAGYSKSHLTLRQNFDTAKFFNCDVQDRNDLKGSFSALPGELSFYSVNVTSQDDATDISAVDCIVVIDYTVLLTEPQVLIKST